MHDVILSPCWGKSTCHDKSSLVLEPRGCSPGYSCPSLSAVICHCLGVGTGGSKSWWHCSIDYINLSPSFVYLQATPTVSGRGSSAKLATAGLPTQSSADSDQAVSAAMAATDSTGVALLHTGSGEGSGGVLPMEVDDDAMFQKKQPKASKADAEQVRPQPYFGVHIASLLYCKHTLEENLTSLCQLSARASGLFISCTWSVSQSVSHSNYFLHSFIHVGYAFGLHPRLMFLSSIAAALCHPSAVSNLSSQL